MKYEISRTSALAYNNGYPHANAIQEPYMYVDERTVDDPMKNRYIGESWYQTGMNHRVENGHIKRDIPSVRWIIEIPDLLEFARQEGPLVLTVGNDIPKIEIYDDYRE